MMFPKRLCGLASASLLFVLTATAAEPFQDCPACPRMVEIPGGAFTMGSPPDEAERKPHEGPRASVKVGTFAMGETEVTRGQYAVFVEETHRPYPARGCYNFGFNEGFDSSDDIEKLRDPHTSWRAHSFPQTDQHPVTCVSWRDASDYAAWLARKTGKKYRLASEAEWEYAARAGTTSTYLWGTDETGACRHANVGDDSLRRANEIIRGQVDYAKRVGLDSVRFVECDDGFAYTAPVHGRQPNAFGLYDVIGNVWEYVADCWREALPEDGRAWDPESCSFRRVRGGSWDDAPAELRSARRSRVVADMPRNDGGFRVARDLTPSERPRERKK